MRASIILVLDNVRSAYNVGSLLRTADGMGVDSVISVGITPHLQQDSDNRLPHVIAGASKQISKTALGAERLMGAHFSSADEVLDYLTKKEVSLLCLEQAEGSESLFEYTPNGINVALVVGNELDGVQPAFLKAADIIIEIPMSGHKESLNVAVGGSIALYHLAQRFATM